MQRIEHRTVPVLYLVQYPEYLVVSCCTTKYLYQVFVGVNVSSVQVWNKLLEAFPLSREQDRDHVMRVIGVVRVDVLLKSQVSSLNGELVNWYSMIIVENLDPRGNCERSSSMNGTPWNMELRSLATRNSQHVLI